MGVDVYLSEFGAERLKIENEEGPLQFLQKGIKDDGKGGKKINPITLRQYELDWLWYYFAVIQFSSKFVAEKIYESFDSQEIEETACVLDLRFIPDDLKIPRDPSDSCYGLDKEFDRKIKKFKNWALGSTELKLTWDTNKKCSSDDQDSDDEKLNEDELR